jgi:hypothetical protein
MPSALRNVSEPTPKRDGISQFQRPIVANVAAEMKAIGTSMNKNLNLCFMTFVFVYCLMKINAVSTSMLSFSVAFDYRDVALRKII